MSKLALEDGASRYRRLIVGQSAPVAAASKLEEVALAIWRAREERLPRHVRRRLSPDDFDRASESWARTVIQARAAIAAMKGPSEEMRHEGAIAFLGHKDEDRLAAAFNVMIDAALAEGR